MRDNIFRNVTQCRQLQIDLCFGEYFYLHHHSGLLFFFEDIGKKLLRNIGKFLS